MILPVHLTGVALVCAWAAQRAVNPWFTIPAGLAIGLAIWTLFEYVFHRWLLHHTRRPLLRKIFWKALHAEHHAYKQMVDTDHHGVHVAISIPIILMLIGIVGMASTGGMALSILSGWIVGYCAYEGLHWHFHSRDPRRGLGRLPLVRKLSEAHTVHHLHKPNMDYGFISTVWDRCLGTYCNLDQVRLEREQRAASLE